MERVETIIVGGGAAGLTAAIACARAGVPPLLLERNAKLGIKILMSGGGRCNVTNTGDVHHLVGAFPRNGRFLYGAFTRFTNDDVRHLLAEEGVATKVEDRGRVFPVADTARSVVAALERAAKKSGARILTKASVESVHPLEDGYALRTEDGSSFAARCLIITVGGVSYPTSGTRGDGFRWAAELGHRIVPLRPAIVALETVEQWPAKVQGVALRGVGVYVHAHGRVWDQYKEDVLFTHFGLSGPAVLNVSHQAVQASEAHPGGVVIGIRIDPAAKIDTWQERLHSRIHENPKRLLKNLFEGWWPASLAGVLLDELGLDPHSQVAQLPKPARHRLAELLWELRLTLKRSRPIEQAMVTSGGVDVREIDPKSMASRLRKGLYFAGEILDVDGVSGGYNLQAAYSTGWVAGESAAAYALQEAEASAGGSPEPRRHALFVDR